MIYTNYKKDLQFFHHELELYLKNCSFYEFPKEIKFLKNPFTKDNELLSLKLDLKRNKIIELYYKNELELI